MDNKLGIQLKITDDGITPFKNYLLSVCASMKTKGYFDNHYGLRVYVDGGSEDLAGIAGRISECHVETELEELAGELEAWSTYSEQCNKLVRD